MYSTYGLNKAVKNPPSNLNELDICMPVLVAMSSNCGFYYIPNFLLLPLPSAWFITGEEQYRCFFYLPFIILGPPDSYFLQMHHCFARNTRLTRHDTCPESGAFLLCAAETP